MKEDRNRAGIGDFSRVDLISWYGLTESSPLLSICLFFTCTVYERILQAGEGWLKEMGSRQKLGVSENDSTDLESCTRKLFRSFGRSLAKNIVCKHVLKGNKMITHCYEFICICRLSILFLLSNQSYPWQVPVSTSNLVVATKSRVLFYLESSGKFWNIFLNSTKFGLVRVIIPWSVDWKTYYFNKIWNSIYMQ